MHRTNGMNNWNARSGYRYRMSVPGPIQGAPSRAGLLAYLAARVFAKQRD
jgi:hypothetical protein